MAIGNRLHSVKHTHQEITNSSTKEAKEKLVKFEYHIQLDLSSYFYQGGMKIEDCQYLATPHPFKGLRVYVCEPQGLKNASEHAYERCMAICVQRIE